MACDDDKATMAQNMRGYVIPVFASLIWIILWILIAMKAMKGTLSSGRGGGWGGKCCRTVLLALCVFQSFYGFLVNHSLNQQISTALMVYPMVGFIALQGNNPAWLLGYAFLNFFPFNYSGYALALSEWNNALYVTANESFKTPDCPDAKSTANLGLGLCWSAFHHYSFCRWGWLRTLQVFSNFNIYSFWFTSFAAFSWYTRGD